MKKTILCLILMIASAQSYGVACGIGMIDNGKGYCECTTVQCLLDTQELTEEGLQQSYKENCNAIYTDLVINLYDTTKLVLSSNPKGNPSKIFDKVSEKIFNAISSDKAKQQFTPEQLHSLKYMIKLYRKLVPLVKGNVILSLQSPNNLKPRWDSMCDTPQYQNAINEYLEDMMNNN